MQILPVKTRRLTPPQDNLLDALLPALPPLREKDLLAITSKVVSLDEGHCLPLDAAPKSTLIAAQADHALPPHSLAGHDFQLTIKHSVLLPSAGIDESNSGGYYTLLPADPFASAQRLWHALREHFGLQDLGILITDSHCVPLRYGTVGISLGHWGFRPLRSYLQTPDLFGRSLQHSRLNLADSLAAAAVLTMGEGNESTPAALLRGVPNLEFTSQNNPADLCIPPREDLYAPLLRAFFASED